MQILNDAFAATGNTYDDFLDVMFETSEKTKIAYVDMSEASIHVYKGKDEENYLFTYLPPGFDLADAIDGKAIYLKKMNMSAAVDVYPGSKEEMEELFSENIMIVSEGRNFFMSKRAIKSLNARFGCDCEALNENSFIRAAVLRKTIDEKNDLGISTTISLVYRADGIRKVLYCGAEDFYFLNDSVFEDIIDEFFEYYPEMRFRYYRISQDITEVFLTDAEEKKDDFLIPGVRICNSVTGDFSLSVSRVLMYPGTPHSYITCKEMNKRHRGGEASTEAFIKKAVKEIKKFSVSKEIKKYTEKKDIPVTSPICLSKRKNQYEAVCRAVSSGIRLVVGKKIFASMIMDAVETTFNESGINTGEDVMKACFMIADIYQGSERRRKNLSCLLHDILMMDLKELEAEQQIALPDKLKKGEQMTFSFKF